MRIYTIGHSTRELDEFLELLRAHGIARLVDVRRYPGSRRYPQFSKEALARSLPAAGIEYEHELALGGRRTPRPDSPNGAWRSPSFRAYADHMEDPEWQEALQRVLGGRAPAALMCAEAVPWRCHRQLISDALTARGHEIRHIIGPGRAEVHTLNPHARVGSGGSLRYPAAEEEQADLF